MIVCRLTSLTIIPRHVRYQHTSSRKNLIPLIKLLHPDLLGHCSDKVKSQNMSCIQNLNDMWDTLESNVQYTSGKSLTFGLDVKTPFRNRYDLSCYVNVPGKSNSNSHEENRDQPEDLIKRQYILCVPDSLCKKQSVSHKVFTSAIESILLQQGKMFEMAGLHNPWEALDPNGDAADGESYSNSPHDRKVGFLSADMEMALFDRWLTKNSLLQEIGSSVDRYGKSKLNRMFDTTHTANGSKHDAVFGSMSASQSFFEDQVDAFIQRGNVLVSPMSPKEEFTAVKQLRTFLIDYGDVLQFSVARWHQAVLLLHRYEGTDKYVSHKKRAQLQMQQGGQASDASSTAPEVPVEGNGGYNVQLHGSHYVVRVPHDFRTRPLLEFMGHAVPFAKLPF